MKRVHLIGICGTAMGTLAALLKQRGFDVSGSDQDVYPPMSEFLAEQGIPVLHGYHAAHITDDLDLVVVGNAISRGNPEVEEVLDRKIRYCSLPEIVRDEFLWGSRSIVVAGTHGKTTTTALVGWLLTDGGKDPTVFVGGIATNFGASYRRGGGRDFIIEGDEYDSAFFDKTAKFFKYLPDIAVVGNIEFDHADIYRDLDEIRLAFRRFVNLIPRRGLLVLGADSPDALALRETARCRVETFGLAEGADWRAYDIEPTDEGTRFRVQRAGMAFGAFEVPLVGLHNVRNALAGLAVGTEAGLDSLALRQGLGAFKGIRRRLEHRGIAAGVTVFDDFAHHPTAVAETIRALRFANPDGRIWAVFEPRSASSCRRVFQDDFARAFDAADEIIIAAVYRSTLPEAERLSPERLVTDLEARGKHGRFVPRYDDIVRTIVAESRPGDFVVLMSNGSFGGIHEKLLNALLDRSSRSRGAHA
jgi:UDP-N-acetylmuramate: L-alanyl-gamma-D-glutamyl-meso-diaminopimelate ligase